MMRNLAILVGLVAAALLLASCGRKDGDGIGAKTPKQAAAQLERAFTNTHDEVHEAVKSAAAGMRDGNYEQAILSLQTVQAREVPSLDQGMAIHQSVVSLETELIKAMASGDPNAKRAYQLLKELKRN